ncbi:MAG: ABC transporter permease [Candidatus Nanopelagicales bacterium]
MNALLISTRAELLRLRSWPSLWVMVGTWLLLNVMFVYVFNYVAYNSGDSTGLTDGLSPAQLLADMLPAAAPESVYQGMPMFGGAIMLILGALTVGSGYGWGTWKTVYTQGPSRLAALGGTLVALAAVVVGVVVLTFGVDLTLSVLVAAAESQDIVLPSRDAVVEGFGVGVLILGMWAACGVAVGTLARGPALAVGLGLVWALAVENLLRGVAGIWSPLEALTNVLPGTAAGSLVGAMGVPAIDEPGGTPGVLGILGGGPAIGLLLGYLAAFVVLTAVMVRRRDVV